MKRTLAFLIIAFSAIALVSAQQGYNHRGEGRGPGHNHEGKNFKNQKFTLEKVSVTGSLTILNGKFAVSSDDTTYITRGLRPYIGFIEGLKYGAAVTVEGASFPVSEKDDVKFLLIEKLTIDGTEYDLGNPPRHGMMRGHKGQGHRPNMHQGHNRQRQGNPSCNNCSHHGGRPSQQNHKRGSR